MYHLGSPNLKYYALKQIHHKLPLRMAKAYFGLRGAVKMRGQVEGMARMLFAINRVFPYFTHHSFDFQLSVSLPEECNMESYFRRCIRRCMNTYVATLEKLPRRELA